MRQQHVLDELSAYLDGECAEPARVAGHLAACPDCARRYEELAAASRRVRALTPPEIRPEFAARVLARVRESEHARYPAGRRGLLSVMVIAAVLAVVVGLPLLYHARPLPEPVPVPGPHVALVAALPSESVLLAELERRALEGEPMGEWALVDDSDEETVSSGEWLDALADADCFDALADAVESSADLDSVVLTLNDEESLALKELLNEDMQPTRPI